MKNQFKLAAQLSCIAIAVTTANAQAQMLGDAIIQFSGNQSNLLAQTGRYVGVVCDALDGAGATDDLADVQAACNAFADNANEINQGSTVTSDGFTAEQLLAGLEDIAPDEIAAIAAGFTDSAQDQMADISGRLAFLRSGIATGVASSHYGNYGGAAGDDASKLSYFVNTNYGFGDKDTTAQESGFDYDGYGLTFGVDYRFEDNMVGGVALSYSESEVDFDRNGGSTDADGLGLTVYGSYYLDDYYFDAVLGYGQHDYDGSRNINIGSIGVGTATSSTEADSLSLSLGAGYSTTINEWNTDYFARLDWLQVDIDGYNETGSFLAMNVGDQEVDSLQVVLGGQVSRSFSQKWGALVPYASLDWRFETDDEIRVVTASYAADDITNNLLTFNSDDSDSNYGLLSLGANFVLAKGRQVFVNYDTVIGLEDVSGNTLTAGFRWEMQLSKYCLRLNLDRTYRVKALGKNKNHGVNRAVVFLYRFF